MSNEKGGGGVIKEKFEQWWEKREEGVKFDRLHRSTAKHWSLAAWNHQAKKLEEKDRRIKELESDLKDSIFQFESLVKENEKLKKDVRFYKQEVAE